MELNWQHDFHEVKDRGLHLFQTEKWSDCSFLVGIAPSQKVIAGHKLILAMASPVFERMFFGPLAAKDEPIVIADVQPEAFQAMLKYIYSDSISISSFEKACELCYVAKKYMMPHVVKLCNHYFWANLSPKNACRAYEFSKLFDEPRLMQTSMELIAGNTREVFADPNFTDIEFSTLMAILDQDKLNIDSELDLFNAVLRIANERVNVADVILQNFIIQSKSNSLSGNSNGGGMLNVEQIKMDPDSDAVKQSHDKELNLEEVDNDASVPEAAEARELQNEVGAGATTAVTNAQPTTLNVAAANLNYFMDAKRLIVDEAMQRQAVKKIRFLTMTPQEFAEGPARSKLLEQHETLAILLNISSPFINDFPMPKGFCTSRSNRNNSYKLRSNPRDSSSNRYMFSTSSLCNNRFFLKKHSNQLNLCSYRPALSGSSGDEEHI